MQKKKVDLQAHESFFKWLIIANHKFFKIIIIGY